MKESDNLKKPNESKDEHIIRLAKKRFDRAVDFESDSRLDRLEDRRFVLGDQWSDWAKRARTQPGRERPMLTINRLPQFRNRVINDIRQSSPGIIVRPVDDEADPKTAEALNGIFRNIQDRTNASQAYDNAVGFAIDEGLGYFRIMTEYSDPRKREQDIVIQSIPDPMKVYFDPASTALDGSDAKFAFIVEEVDTDECREMYPDIDPADWERSGNGDGSWVLDNTVRVAEYFYIESTTVDDQDVDGEPIRIEKKRCKWCKIVGNRIADAKEMPCSFIPVIPVVGNERWMEGKRYLWGLIRFAKDPQRQYNFTESAKTEYIAMSPKQPFIMALGQDEGLEAEWNSLNSDNLPTLHYNPVTLEGNLAPAPQRQAPPQISSALVQASQQSLDDMQATMGIYNVSLGSQESVEKSGIALRSRQHQSDIGNFHYSDNLAASLKHAGRIILEMIPVVWDTRRVARLLNEDGSHSMAVIDPQLPQPHAKMRTEDGAIQNIYNPSIGKYDITISVGPAYQTRRQEAADSIERAIQAFPPLMQVAGDLLVKAQDWPDADVIAERLKRTMDPNIVKDKEDEDEGGMSPEVQQAAQQMDQMAQQMEQMSQEIGNLQDAKAKEEAELEIKRYQAETDRLKVESSFIKPEILGPMVYQAVAQIIQGGMAFPESQEGPEQMEPMQMQGLEQNMGLEQPEGREQQMPMQIQDQQMPMQSQGMSNT